jgi:hypothetical protein
MHPDPINGLGKAQLIKLRGLDAPPTPSSKPPQAGSNYTNPQEEPTDHALGRSRGGVSTKIHQLVDGRGRPLVIAR